MARKKPEPYVQVEEAEDEDKEELTHKFDMETTIRFYAKNGRDWIQVEFDDSMDPWLQHGPIQGLSIMVRCSQSMLVRPVSDQRAHITIGR